MIFFHLFSPVHCLTSHCLVKINIVSIELRPLNTGKTHFTCYCNPTGTTHSCTVNHKGIQTDN